MKKRFDIFLAVILVLLLVIGILVNSILIRGILLLLFTIILIINTVWSLLLSIQGKVRDVVIYSILLFFEAVLAIGSMVVIISTILNY